LKPFARGTGYLPDRPDARDVRARDVFGAVAALSFASVRTNSPIKSQRSTSSCVGQAWSRALRDAYIHAGLDSPELSALFAYLLGRATHGAEDRDEGTYVRAVAKAIIKLGCAAEAVHPFSVLRVNRGASLKALRDAFARRGLRGYYRLDSGDVYGVRLALSARCPVVAGWDIDKAFKSNRGALIDEITGPIVAGHAMEIDEAYPDGNFGLANSWNTTWGRSGYGLVTERFVAKARDVWVVDVKS
jgi:hypothetical protein